MMRNIVVISVLWKQKRDGMVKFIFYVVGNIVAFVLTSYVVIRDFFKKPAPPK